MFYDQIFPETYLLFLQNKNNKYMMPSFHYNIALALLNKGKGKGKGKEAKFWLQQSVELEPDNIRHKKILQGTF